MRERRVRVLHCACERVAAGSDGGNNNNNSTELRTASRGQQPAQSVLPIDLYPDQYARPLEKSPPLLMILQTQDDWRFKHQDVSCSDGINEFL